MKGFSARALAVFGCFLLLAAGTEVKAGDCITNQDGKVVCGEGQCAADQHGKVFCAKAGGGAMKDRDGHVKCGVGYCASDDMGQMKCSTKPGGGAETNSNGKVKCLGGCQNARAQLCAAGR